MILMWGVLWFHEFSTKSTTVLQTATISIIIIPVISISPGHTIWHSMLGKCGDPAGIIPVYFCIFLYISVYFCIFLYISVYFCIHTHLYIYMYIYIHACIHHIFIHIYIYVYTTYVASGEMPPFCKPLSTLGPSTWPLGAALVSVFVSSTCFFEFLVANVGVIPGYPGLQSELNFFAKKKSTGAVAASRHNRSLPPSSCCYRHSCHHLTVVFFTVALAWQKVGENIGYHLTKGTNLVGGAITILKNDGVRQWEGWHPIYEMENNPFMFETSNQTCYRSILLTIQNMMQPSNLGRWSFFDPCILPPETQTTSGFVWKCWVYSQWNSHLKTG